MEAQYDIFMSYAHGDAASVEPIVDALVDAGLRVWFDTSAVEDFASISRGVESGLRHSKALLAFYSTTYPTRRACQWELAAAFLAAQAAGDPRERVLVVNPEAGVGHIEPVELRDARFRTAPQTAVERKRLAAATKHRLAHVEGALGRGAPPLQPFYGLKPLASTRFVGRMPEFWRLHSALQLAAVPLVSGEHEPSVAALVGMGGIGKTLLAEEYALRFAAAYPGGVFWLRAAGSDGTLDAPALDAERQRQFLQLALELGLEPTEDVERALAVALENRRPALWVVDDLPEGLTATQIRRWLSPSPSARTLLTTRSRRYGALARIVELEVLEPEDGYELLARRRRLDGGEETAARSVVDELGCHPLAIDVAAGSVVASGQTFAAFCAALGDKSRDELELAAELADVLPSGHQTSIAATFLRSLALLSPPAHDVVGLAAQLGPAPIALELVVASFRALGLPLSEASAQASAGAREAIELSLLSGEGDELRPLHTLIRRTVQRHVAAEEQGALRTAAASAVIAVLLSVTDAQEANDSAAEFVHGRELVGQINAGKAGILERLLAREDVLAGRLDAAVAALERSVSELASNLGVDDVETLRARKDLVGVLRDRGDYVVSRNLGEAALAGARQLLGDQHLATADLLLELGRTLECLDEPEQAIAALEEALALRIKISGPADRETLRVKDALATVFRSQHRLDEAVRLQEEILAAIDGRPERSMVTLRALNALAALRHEQGELAEARSLFGRVVAARRERFGDEHPLTLTALNNLGQVLRTLNDRKALRALNEEVLAATNARAGGEHPNTLAAMTNLALVLADEGELEQALDLHGRVLGVRRRRLGDGHRSTLTAMNNVGDVLRKLGRRDEARSLLEEAARGLAGLLGDDHPDTLTVRLNLAKLLDEQGDSDAAIAIARAVLTARRKVDGETHPRTLAAIGNLAAMLETAGARAEAADLFSAMRRNAEEALGAGHPLTAAAVRGQVRLSANSD